MNRYLVLMSGFLLGAISMAVLVFVLVLQYQNDIPSTPLATEVSDTTTEENTLRHSGVEAESDLATSTTGAPLQAIPLKNVPLSSTQASTLEMFGVDPETFVITPAMQECAITLLGQERIRTLQKGDSPSLGELYALRDCL